MTLAIVLLVAGLIVGGGVGYFAAPPKTVSTTVTTTVQIPVLPLKGKTVKLGYIASTTTGLETARPFRVQIIEHDMNDYAKVLGHDTVFQWQIDDAVGQPNTHLEKVQGFKSMGITVFEGGGWSSMAQAALNYVNTNNMLMWSTSSTSPILSIENDRLLRMCPSDASLAPALAKVAWSYGIKYVCFVQRGDSWGDGIKNLFEAEWKALGGQFTGEVIRYAGEATEFANYLATADQQLSTAITQYGQDRVGGIMLSFDEAVTIITQASDYPAVFSSKWFGGDGTAKSSRILQDASQNAAVIRMYSLLAAASQTSKFTSLDARYFALTALPISSYTAYQYDVGMILLTTILERQSEKADDIYPLQLPTCDNWFGAGGWCKLNAWGDRVPPPFDIWGYGQEKGQGPITFVRYATFDLDAGTTTWDPDALGFTPVGP